MATVLSDIADLFLTRIDDYRITTIYNTSGSTAVNTYLEPYLISAIVDFDICTPTLVYTETSGSVEGFFDIDLTRENKVILSQIMELYWMEHTINEREQLSNFVSDKDFKAYSPAANLSAKREYRNALREEISNILVKYSYGHNNWDSWRNQDFIP